VVVENIYRFIDEGYEQFEAAKLAVGEVAVPIIASTATTLAAFLPLIFWDSIMGEFMKWMPITLIIVLTSSLFVALVINPVISSTFIKKETEDEGVINKKRALIIAGVLFILSIPFYIFQFFTIANLLAIGGIITMSNLLILNKIGIWFQKIFLVRLENAYQKVLRYSITGRAPYYILVGSFAILGMTLGLLKRSQPEILFFPDGDPNYVNVQLEMPIGTDITETDAMTKILYDRVIDIVGEDTVILKSIVSNVGEGAKAQDKLGGS